VIRKLTHTKLIPETLVLDGPLDGPLETRLLDLLSLSLLESTGQLERPVLKMLALADQIAFARRRFAMTELGHDAPEDGGAQVRRPYVVECVSTPRKIDEEDLEAFTSVARGHCVGRAPQLKHHGPHLDF
jgi:hypothetical protein